MTIPISIHTIKSSRYLLLKHKEARLTLRPTHRLTDKAFISLGRTTLILFDWFIEDLPEIVVGLMGCEVEAIVAFRF